VQTRSRCARGEAAGQWAHRSAPLLSARGEASVMALRVSASGARVSVLVLGRNQAWRPKCTVFLLFLFFSFLFLFLYFQIQFEFKFKLCGSPLQIISMKLAVLYGDIFLFIYIIYIFITFIFFFSLLSLFLNSNFSHSI
jgi:hypothetical protein